MSKITDVDLTKQLFVCGKCGTLITQRVDGDFTCTWCGSRFTRKLKKEMQQLKSLHRKENKRCRHSI